MSETPPIRVLVVDDQAPFRMAARMVLDRSPGFDLVGEAASGEESVDRVAELEPDLVLMDINMGAMSGLDATRLITGAHPATVVILCSTYSRDDLPEGAMECGAAGYLHKEELGPDQLRRLWDDRLPA